MQSMHEDSTEGEGMKRQQRMKIRKNMTKKIGSKGRKGAERRQSCGGRLREKVGSIQERMKPCKNGMFGWRR